ncbi:MAG: hypothetical protein COB68_05300, partial [SAR202 cluster bacterium]
DSLQSAAELLDLVSPSLQINRQKSGDRFVVINYVDEIVICGKLCHGHHHGLECLVGQTRLVRRRGQRLSGGNILQDFSSQIRFPKLVTLWYAYDYKAILPIVQYIFYLKFEEIS